VVKILFAIKVFILEDFDYFTSYFTADALCGTDTMYGLFTCLCDTSMYDEYPDIKI
jgi:hypothetical protein